MSAVPSRPRNSVRSAVGFTTAPESRCEPGCLPFSSTATGTSPRRSGHVRRVLEQLAEPDRTREAGRAGADDQHADVDALVLRVRGLGHELARLKRRRELRGPDAHAPLRARTSSVSFGTTSLTSPTTARSANSKMGAFGSLLIATITFEDCIPTLCWIAPEMPQPM